MYSGLKRTLLRNIRKFGHHRSGVAAVEFAYLAPLLMLMTFGTFELSRGLIVHKRFQRATAMIGDLVAREEQLGATPHDSAVALNGMMNAAKSSIAPYDVAPLKLAVSQVRAAMVNPVVSAIVEWTYSYNGKIVTACPNSRSLTSGMVTSGNWAIIVDADYRYSPVFNGIASGIVKQENWTDTITFAPRKGSVSVSNIALPCTTMTSAPSP